MGWREVIKKEGRFSCEKCNYKTFTASLLHSHSRTHSSEKPFKCPNLGCDYKTRWPFYLPRHQRWCRGQIQSPAAETSEGISIVAAANDKRRSEGTTVLLTQGVVHMDPLLNSPSILQSPDPSPTFQCPNFKVEQEEEINLEIKRETPEEVQMDPTLNSSSAIPQIQNPPSAPQIPNCRAEEEEGEIDNNSEIFYPCSYPDCTYKSKRLENVGLHEELHSLSGNTDFFCRICTRNYPSLVSFLHHMSSKHSVKSNHDQLSCPFCPFIGQEFPEFKAHMLAHSSITQPVVNNVRAQESAWIRKSALTTQTGFPCPGCSHIFTRKGNLLRHQQKSCSNSLKSGSNSGEIQVKVESDFTQPSSISDDGPKIEPKTINASTQNRDESTRHQNDETKSRLTDELTRNWDESALDLDEWTRNLNESTQNQIDESNLFVTDEFYPNQVSESCCPYPDCGYKTSHTITLQTHIKSHHEFVSTTEPTDYPEETQPYQGMEQAGEQRALYRCDKCSYKTSKEWHMKKHIRIHSAEKPFKCPNLGCDYKTRWPYDLKRHRRWCRGQIQSPAAETSDGISIVPGNDKRRSEGTTVLLTQGVVHMDPLLNFPSILQSPDPSPTLLQCPNFKVEEEQEINPEIKHETLENLTSRNIQIEPSIINVQTPSRSSKFGKSNFCRSDKIEGFVRISSYTAFACKFCEFIGLGELSALKHSCQHKTVVISLNRI